ncbi:MAG: UDP-3-O-[3-hydroxymyristoyl] N-acetylglucosamine deacetylase [Hyphomicrobiales bacterium]|nr:MAG: UDP-3-O-[3-hydroxymyristoyl] N-acetylglucosamine deacetylase [Hyphomicrobiales bacterium]
MSSLQNTKQITLCERVTMQGVGVHSGKPVSMTIHPGDVNTGIVFLRTDPVTGREFEVPANYKTVLDTRLCTTIGVAGRGMVATIEHLMAAFFGYGIDNAIVELDSNEVPVMDGSSRQFLDAFDQAGLKQQSALRRYLKILKPVRVESGESFGELLPYAGRRFEVEISFDCPTIGTQSFRDEMSPAIFREHISRARTFGFMRDVKTLWANNLALGSSLDNSVVIDDDDSIVNPEGLRYEEEFVRHKTLDAVGDLALAGFQIEGIYRSFRGGHSLNFKVLEALFADDGAWEISDSEVRVIREPGRASYANAAISPVFGPEVS